MRIDCEEPKQCLHRFPILMEGDHVSALEVVHLARELKRHSIVDFAQIQDIDCRLADQVVDLEEGRDISDLMTVRYPESWMITLWRMADASPSAADIGVRVGAAISPKVGGLLVNLLQHCEDLEEVLDTYLENIGMDNASESWQVSQEDNCIHLEFRFISGKPYPRCAVERSMVALYHWAEYLFEKRVPLCLVEFSFPEPEYIDSLKFIFSCEIRFNCGRNAFVLPKEVLSMRLPKRSHHLKSIFKQVISSVDFQIKEHSVEKRVLGLLRENLRAYNNIDSLAQALYMSRTTLYRRLKEENTSFSHLLDKERQRLFARHRNRTAAQLCDLLGFRDTSAYYKARKRWGVKRD